MGNAIRGWGKEMNNYFTPKRSDCDSNIVGLWNEDAEVCLRCGANRTALREMIAEGGKGSLTMVNHILEGCPACKKALEGRS